MSLLVELAGRWESDAELLEQYENRKTAALIRRLAAELREAIRTEENELLTLAGAARESGYHEDHIRHGIANGDLPNAGRKGAPRIRREDLPRKPGGRANKSASPEAAAADILARLEGNP